MWWLLEGDMGPTEISLLLEGNTRARKYAYENDPLERH